MFLVSSKHELQGNCLFHVQHDEFLWNMTVSNVGLLQCTAVEHYSVLQYFVRANWRTPAMRHDSSICRRIAVSCSGLVAVCCIRILVVCWVCWSTSNARPDIFLHNITLSYVWHASVFCAAWRFHVRDKTLPFVWHDSVLCANWHIPTQYHFVIVWLAAILCAAWRIHVRDMTLPYMYHDSILWTVWCIHVCDMTWCFHMLDVTLLYVRTNIYLHNITLSSVRHASL